MAKKDVIRPLPCSSSPNHNRFAGLRFGFSLAETISSVSPIVPWRVFLQRLKAVKTRAFLLSSSGDGGWAPVYASPVLLCSSEKCCESACQFSGFVMQSIWRLKRYIPVFFLVVPLPFSIAPRQQIPEIPAADEKNDQRHRFLWEHPENCCFPGDKFGYYMFLTLLSDHLFLGRRSP